MSHVMLPSDAVIAAYYDAKLGGKTEEMTAIREAHPALAALPPDDTLMAFVKACQCEFQEMTALAEKYPVLLQRIHGWQASPLHNVIDGRQPPKLIVQKLTYLLERGADANARGHLGQTPFMSAIKFGEVEAMRVLLQYGANPYLTNDAGDTPEQMAKQHRTGKSKDDVLAVLAEAPTLYAEYVIKSDTRAFHTGTIAPLKTSGRIALRTPIGRR